MVVGFRPGFYSPTDLAKKIAHILKRMTFTSSKMSLYIFVEVFLFKYLSDINVLKAKTLLAISTAYMPWMKLPA